VRERAGLNIREIHSCIPAGNQPAAAEGAAEVQLIIF
jgi:hypothetical protein